MQVIPSYNFHHTFASRVQCCRCSLGLKVQLPKLAVESSWRRSFRSRDVQCMDHSDSFHLSWGSSWRSNPVDRVSYQPPPSRKGSCSRRRARARGIRASGKPWVLTAQNRDKGLEIPLVCS